MPTLDAKSLLADPAPIWFDDQAPDTVPAGDEGPDTVPGGFYADPLQAALAQVDAARQRPALAVVPPPAADPLAMALPWLVRHLGVAAAVEAVVGPVHEDRLVPSDDVLPALRRIGFDAHLQRRSLASLTPSDLPTVLLLNSGDACVLTARWQDAQGQAQCSVVLPGPQPDEFSTAEAEIDAEYSGVALLVNPPRPPFASALALARARAGAGAGAAAAAGAAAGAGPSALATGAAAAPILRSATAPTADALVALAAAVQQTQRSRQAAAPQPPVVPQTAAPAAARQRREPSLGAPAVATPAAPGAAGQVSAMSGRQRREPVLGGLPGAPDGGQDDDEAALLKLSFLRAERSVHPAPAQVLRRIGQDTRVLLRSSAGLLVDRLGQAGRALARLLTAARLHLGRRSLQAAQALRRGAQAAGQASAQALGQAGQRLRRCHQAGVARLRQARHRRQARLALADEALCLPALGATAAGQAAGQGGSGAWADSLAQAWQDAALDELAALAPQPDAVLAAAFASTAAAAALAPVAAGAPAGSAVPVATVATVASAASIAPAASIASIASSSSAPVASVASRPACPSVPAPTASRPPAARPARTFTGPAQALAQARQALAQARLPALAPALQACGAAARGLAGAAAGHRWSWMPGLAAGSALCLLVGVPQAWAGMVSGSGLQALQVAPTLLRSALAADIDQAARALGQPARGRLAQPSGQAVQARLPAEPARTAPPARPVSGQRGVPRRARHACR